MIKQTKALVDRRKDKRFQVQSGALVKFNRHATKLGQTLDISIGGLAFNYVAQRKLPQGSCVIEILFADYGFFLNDIGFETIWDIKTHALPAGSMAMRQRGVKFIGLSRHQEVQLAAIFKIEKKRSAERRHAKEAAELAYAELNQIFETAADAMRVIDRDFNMVRCNQTFWTLTGARDAEGRKCYDVFPGSLCHTPQCPLSRIIHGEERVECQIDKVRPDGSKIPCILTATPFRQTGGELIGIVEDFKDISHIKQVEVERERTIAELQRAMAEVKVLSGLLPVCVSCKKIRDDNGYWNQIEAYVREHSEADFTHSICPDCTEKLYPDLVNEGGLPPLD
ncbi:MAG: PAS domain-containing protein [Deltaproteobacteria bacterium]|nr:PAS domain-containing protein [Deltaproteobacteria bacterium]